MKHNKVLKIFCLIAGSFLAAYIIICDFFVSFSISVTLTFVVGSALLFLTYYMLSHPINKEEREPSFTYIFIMVSTIMYFSIMIFLIIFNILYPKNYLKENSDYDYIIVFGAGISSGKNEIMNSRIDKAIEYAKIYSKCRFVLTGAKGDEEPIEEAYYMRNYMRTRGIDEKMIIVEPFSTNTYENILNSLELIKNDVIKRNARENIITRPFNNTKETFDMDFLNIGFMSSDFHLSRINMMAKKKGIFRPFDILCETKIQYKLYMYVRENLSFIKALVLNQLEL